MRRAVLVGNGINFSCGAWTWKRVVKELAKSVGSPLDQSDLAHVPFSLLADRVLCQGDSASDEFFHELDTHLDGLTPSPVHSRVMAGDFTEILTTNYDLTLERAIGLTREGCTNQGWAKESKYSQFRHVLCPRNVRVWHIHGALTHRRSLLLGYSRYAGYLQVLRQTMTEEREYRGSSFGPWTNLVRAEPPVVWPPMVFSHDLLMLGVGMDFAETHLWWLLAYRAEQFNLTARKTNSRNRVIFVWNVAGERKPRHRARARQLEAFGVRVVERSWEGDDWSEGYLEVLDQFANGTL